MEETRPKQTTVDPIPEPEPAHTQPRQSPEDQAEYGITELNDVAAGLPLASRVLTRGERDDRWHAPVRKFWRHQVRVSVQHQDCRDHLANERTFLGYLRTSVALSMIGVLIAQLYRLSHDPSPNPVFGYYILSKPLSAIFQSSALATVLLGAFRYWRHQNAMVRGKAHVGGLEMMVASFYLFLLMFMMFAIHVSIPIYKAMIHSR